MSFVDHYATIDWHQQAESIAAKTGRDVERALAKTGRRDLDDFQALIAPAARPYLEHLAQESVRLTRQRFGNTIQLYVPLYVSNACTNSCSYCGFSLENKIKRVILDEAAIDAEIAVIEHMGFDNVLLLTGEAEKRVGFPYLRDCLRQLRRHFSSVAMEVQPLSTDEYTALVAEGLHAVYLYQETYNRAAYDLHHRAGRKKDLSWRLDGPDRLGQAGVHKIGLGCLIGLEDWRVDSFFTACHLDYLERNYWRTRYSVSFPRLRPHAGPVQPVSVMSDADLVQLICAWRIFDQEVELALSTRENARFRDQVCKLGITSMSAASCTNPGGYAQGASSLEQFAIDDDRSARAVAAALKAQGLEAVWKDWDAAYDRRAG